VPLLFPLQDLLDEDRIGQALALARFYAGVLLLSRPGIDGTGILDDPGTEGLPVFVLSPVNSHIQFLSLYVRRNRQDSDLKHHLLSKVLKRNYGTDRRPVNRFVIAFS